VQSETDGGGTWREVAKQKEQHFVDFRKCIMILNTIEDRTRTIVSGDKREPVAEREDGDV
jgi:hypothetical protein